MASPKDKPRGYFKYILTIDCETTGLCFKNDNPVHNEKTGEQHQTVSWGVVVADADTLQPIEKLYVEIKWNDNSIEQKRVSPEFGKRAAEIHGLSQSYLDEHGVTEEEAIGQIGGLILKYWGPDNCIQLLGHNVHTFDLPFLRDLFCRYGIDLNFGSRHYDTNSIGFATFGTYNSDDLFSAVGFDLRTEHNALDDALMALESARVIKLIFQSTIG